LGSWRHWLLRAGDGWEGKVEFRILGPLEVTAGGQSLEVGGARTRAVLAMLLVHANRVVSADRLAAELWPGHPADRAVANLQVRLSELRKALRSAGEADRLVTRPPGYLLRVASEELDALRFAELAAGGDAALAAGDAVIAAQRLDEALSLWRGPALADVDAAAFARAEAARLEETRLAALESRVEAMLACGRHRELIAELETLTAAHPLRERLWSQRMLALYRAGRQADALGAYRDLRAILVGELAIEPSPELRLLHARILRQDPALGRPSGRGARSEGDAPPETRYVQSDDGVHIAYQVLGEGELDIVAVPGLISHLDLWWEDPVTARFFRQLASLGRLIMFDKRDTGLSDRASSDAPLEQRMDDVRAVMRACGSAKAALFGYSEGGPMSILFTATYPERVTSLILGAAAARWPAAPDYPCGHQTEEMISALEALAAHRWGQGDSIEWYAPSRAGSARARQAFARWERMSASPSALLRVIRMIRAIDVRSVLPAIGVPTLIIQRHDDRITPPCHGRYLAEHLPHARYFEQPGDHVLWVGDTDAMFTQIHEFLTAARHPSDPGRVLATILCTGPAATVAGDRPPAMLDACQAAGRRDVETFRGRLINSTGDGILATFDGPGRAIRCAAAVRDDAAALGIPIRAAVHTGEVEFLGGDVIGMSVQIAAQVAALAQPAEILVSRTVKELVAGSGICFADRGNHELSGISAEWPLFAVAAL
jgi:DNA-binding SARP family transcriptional activator/pimeloyl-ACP methyl ester carboxylesterase